MTPPLFLAIVAALVAVNLSPLIHRALHLRGLRRAQARDDRRYAGGRVVAMRRRRTMREG